MPIVRLKNGMGASEEPPPPKPRDCRPPKSKTPWPFEEELALFRVEQTEAAQVDLALVVFDLREVGVPGHVGGEPVGNAELEVAADVARPVVVDVPFRGTWLCEPIAYGFSSIPPRSGGRLETDERRGVGEPQQPVAGLYDWGVGVRNTLFVACA